MPQLAAYGRDQRVGVPELSEKHLKIAKELGLDVAKSNLEELAKKKANAIEIRKKSK